jgi:hypothetical protein
LISVLEEDLRTERSLGRQNGLGTQNDSLSQDSESGFA